MPEINQHRSVQRGRMNARISCTEIIGDICSYSGYYAQGGASVYVSELVVVKLTQVLRSSRMTKILTLHGFVMRIRAPMPSRTRARHALLSIRFACPQRG